MTRHADYRAVYDAEYDRLRRWLCSRVHPDLAEEITQEAFARLWAHWDVVEAGGHAAWTWTVARNLLASEYRRRPKAPLWLAPWMAVPEDGWREAVEDRAELARVWPWLTDKQRAVLALHFGEECTYPEVAAALGLGTAEAARGLAQRGWHRLRVWMTPD